MNTFYEKGKEYTIFMEKKCAVHTFDLRSIKRSVDFDNDNELIKNEGDKFFYSYYTQDDYIKHCKQIEINNKYYTPSPGIKLQRQYAQSNIHKNEIIDYFEY